MSSSWVQRIPSTRSTMRDKQAAMSQPDGLGTRHRPLTVATSEPGENGLQARHRPAFPDAGCARWTTMGLGRFAAESPPFSQEPVPVPPRSSSIVVTDCVAAIRQHLEHPFTTTAAIVHDDLDLSLARYGYIGHLTARDNQFLNGLDLNPYDLNDPYDLTVMISTAHSVCFPHV